MKLTLDAAERIAKRVNSKLSEWDIPISVRPGVIIMISLVMREIRLEAKRQTDTSED